MNECDELINESSTSGCSAVYQPFSFKQGVICRGLGGFDPPFCNFRSFATALSIALACVYLHTRPPTIFGTNHTLVCSGFKQKRLTGAHNFPFPFNRLGKVTPWFNTVCAFRAYISAFECFPFCLSSVHAFPFAFQAFYPSNVT